MMAAGLSIALGAKTLLIERSPETLGGECTNTGCVPSKSLLYAASLKGSDGGEGSPAQVSMP
jgi:pyruvate/2-oxoglutarate dehydrogenase complex dihydrolipoamide dehydrogenase (E3) component